jgi:hypothetical protein
MFLDVESTVETCKRVVGINSSDVEGKYKATQSESGAGKNHDEGREDGEELIRKSHGTVTKGGKGD